MLVNVRKRSIARLNASRVLILPSFQLYRDATLDLGAEFSIAMTDLSMFKALARF